MEGVYEELDEAKAEIEKLKEELRRKSELTENLNKSHNEQIRKAHEASLRIEKQAQEISEKAEEISVMKRAFEEVQGSLNEKDSAVKHLRVANEKLRSGCDEKLKKREEENKGLVLALEESNGKSFDLEQRIMKYKEEIESLKWCLSVSQKKKCLEAEKTCNRSKEVRERDDALLGLEEEKRKIEEQLKWKKEQFGHLEEAHRKAKVQFKASEKEWESEKSSLLDEISSLETRLDSQTRTSEDLRSRLQMCNQALAREEIRRKSLEVQISDMKNRFENVFGDFQDPKSQLESLAEKRDVEIASLRHSLEKKESLLKEIEHQKRQADQENDEMRILLKEFRESQIQKPSGGSPSVAKLRNKLKCSEQLHKESTANLNSQIEAMKQELCDFGSRLERKDETINKLGMELKRTSEDCASVKAEMGKVEAELENRDAVIEELRMALENFHIREVERKFLLETTMSDLEKKYMSKLESKEETIADLRTELDRVHEDYLGKLEAKEAEKSSQLEKVTNDLSNYRSLLESRDVMLKELRLELEQVRSEFGDQFLAQEAKWKSRVEMGKDDLEKCESRLERKEQAIKELEIELERQNEDFCAKLGTKEAEAISQLEEAKRDLDKYRSLLESKDATLKELRLELEQVRGEFGDQFLAQEAKWKSRVETGKDDLEKCESQLERKEQAIKELEIELERQNEDFCANLGTKEAEAISQLEKAKSDLDKYQSLLESKDAKIKALKLELEQVRGEFIEDLKAKEVEWTCQLEMMTKDLDKCRSERDDKDARIEELRMDLENCHSSILQLKLHNEEISVMLLVLKNGIFDAQLKTVNEKAEMEGDIDRYQEMLMESSICELLLREQNFQIESVLKKKLKKVYQELERAKSELAEKICQGNGAEFDLYIWKSIAEHFKVGLEESFETRRELEASLLAQVIVCETVEQEKRQILRSLEERNERIANLQRQVAFLEQESLRRELEEFLVEKIGAERRLSETEVASKASDDRLKEKLRNSEDILGFVDDRVGEISRADKNLMEMLESVLAFSCEDSHCQRRDSSVDAKENVNNSPTMTTKCEANSEIRSPFREINS